MDKYQNLARELKWLWKVNTSIMPIVVGALGRTLTRNSSRDELANVNFFTTTSYM